MNALLEGAHDGMHAGLIFVFLDGRQRKLQGGFGNLLMLQPVVLAEAYGLHSYARIFASANAMTTLGVASGPLALGIVYELGGYSMSYNLAAALSALALIVLVFAGKLPNPKDAKVIATA